VIALGGLILGGAVAYFGVLFALGLRPQHLREPEGEHG
jgi:hypothetical protein